MYCIWLLSLDWGCGGGVHSGKFQSLIQWSLQPLLRNEASWVCACRFQMSSLALPQAPTCLPMCLAVMPYHAGTVAHAEALNSLLPSKLILPPLCLSWGHSFASPAGSNQSACLRQTLAFWASLLLLSLPARDQLLGISCDKWNSFFLTVQCDNHHRTCYQVLKMCLVWLEKWRFILSIFSPLFWLIVATWSVASIGHSVPICWADLWAFPACPPTATSSCYLLLSSPCHWLPCCDCQSPPKDVSGTGALIVLFAPVAQRRPGAEFWDVWHVLRAGVEYGGLCFCAFSRWETPLSERLSLLFQH